MQVYSRTEIDILGMQEVLHNQFLDLRSGLPEYDGIGVGRDDGKTAGDVCSIYSTGKIIWSIGLKHFLVGRESRQCGHDGWDAVCVRIATWAKFREKSTGKIFMAVNTHFDHIGEEARAKVRYLLSKR